MRFTRWKGRALGAAVLAGSLGACDFITASEGNPNAVPAATLDQLFTASQVNTYFATEDQLARIAAIWTQQAAGTDRQFSILDVYTHSESSGDGEFGSAYIGGGLVDLRLAQEQATEANRLVYRGILKVHEAYLIGRVASVWGAVPYSEAANREITEPKLDDQQAVYAAVQSVLDGAIADLQSGTGAGPGSVDMSFGGNAQRWIATANTLKARYYIHWAEAQRAGGASAAAAQTACGGDCIAKAVAAANAGISAAAGDWRTVHGSAATEENVWSQFMTQRSGYIAGGAFMVDSLLDKRGDPRLSRYYTLDADTADTGPGAQYTGSRPGQNLGTASSLNIAPTQRMDIATCAETQFIKAEALFYQGNAAGARSAAEAGVACAAAEEGLTAAAIPVAGGGFASLSGQALLAEIITQKYLAMFLNVEVYNDYKRTCLPAFSTYNGNAVPRRLFYAAGERVANKNIPGTDAQPRFNANDPNGC